MEQNILLHKDYEKDIPHFYHCLKTVENAKEMLGLCLSVTEMAYYATYLYNDRQTAYSIDSEFENALMSMHLHQNLNEQSDILGTLRQYKTKMKQMLDELCRKAGTTYESLSADYTLYDICDTATNEPPVAVNDILLYLFQYRHGEKQQEGHKFISITLDELYDEQDTLFIRLSSDKLGEDFCRNFLDGVYFEYRNASIYHNMYKETDGVFDYSGYERHLYPNGFYAVKKEDKFSRYTFGDGEILRVYADSISRMVYTDTDSKEIPVTEDELPIPESWTENIRIGLKQSIKYEQKRLADTHTDSRA